MASSKSSKPASTKKVKASATNAEDATTLTTKEQSSSRSTRAKAKTPAKELKTDTAKSANKTAVKSTAAKFTAASSANGTVKGTAKKAAANDESSDMKAEAKAAVKPEVKTAAKREAKVAAKGAAKSVAKAGTKSSAKSKASTKTTNTRTAQNAGDEEFLSAAKATRAITKSSAKMTAVSAKAAASVKSAVEVEEPPVTRARKSGSVNANEEDISVSSKDEALKSRVRKNEGRKEAKSTKACAVKKATASAAKTKNAKAAGKAAAAADAVATAAEADDAVSVAPADVLAMSVSAALGSMARGSRATKTGAGTVGEGAKLAKPGADGTDAGADDLASAAAVAASAAAAVVDDGEELYDGDGVFVSDTSQDGSEIIEINNASYEYKKQQDEADAAVLASGGVGVDDAFDKATEEVKAISQDEEQSFSNERGPKKHPKLKSVSGKDTTTDSLKKAFPRNGHGNINDAMIKDINAKEEEEFESISKKAKAGFSAANSSANGHASANHAQSGTGGAGQGASSLNAGFNALGDPINNTSHVSVTTPFGKVREVRDARERLEAREEELYSRKAKTKAHATAGGAAGVVVGASANSSNKAIGEVKPHLVVTKKSSSLLNSSDHEMSKGIKKAKKGEDKLSKLPQKNEAYAPSSHGSRGSMSKEARSSLDSGAHAATMLEETLDNNFESENMELAFDFSQMRSFNQTAPEDELNRNSFFFTQKRELKLKSTGKGLEHVNGKTFDLKELVPDLRLLSKDDQTRAEREFLNSYNHATDRLLACRRLERLGARDYANLSVEDLQELIRETLPQLTESKITDLVELFTSIPDEEAIWEYVNTDENFYCPDGCEALIDLLCIDKNDVKENALLEKTVRFVTRVYIKHEYKINEYLNSLNLELEGEAYDLVAFFYYLLAVKTGKQHYYNFYENMIMVQNHARLFGLMFGSFNDLEQFETAYSDDYLNDDSVKNIPRYKANGKYNIDFDPSFKRVVQKFNEDLDYYINHSRDAFMDKVNELQKSFEDRGEPYDLEYIYNRAQQEIMEIVEAKTAECQSRLDERSQEVISRWVKQTLIEHECHCPVAYSSAQELLDLMPHGLHFCYLKNDLEHLSTFYSQIILALLGRVTDTVRRAAYSNSFKEDIAFTFDFMSPLSLYVLSVTVNKAAIEAVSETAEKISDPERAPLFFYDTFCNEEQVSSLMSIPDYKIAHDKFAALMPDAIANNSFTDEMKEWALHLSHQVEVYRGVMANIDQILTYGQNNLTNRNAITLPVMCEIMAFYSRYNFNQIRHDNEIGNLPEFIADFMQDGSVDDEDDYEELEVVNENLLLHLVQMGKEEAPLAKEKTFTPEMLDSKLLFESLREKKRAAIIEELTALNADADLDTDSLNEGSGGFGAAALAASAVTDIPRAKNAIAASIASKDGDVGAAGVGASASHEGAYGAAIVSDAATDGGAAEGAPRYKSLEERVEAELSRYDESLWDEANAIVLSNKEQERLVYLNRGREALSKKVYDLSKKVFFISYIAGEFGLISKENFKSFYEKEDAQGRVKTSYVPSDKISMDEVEEVFKAVDLDVNFRANELNEEDSKKVLEALMHVQADHEEAEDELTEADDAISQYVALVTHRKDEDLSDLKEELNEIDAKLARDEAEAASVAGEAGTGAASANGADGAAGAAGAGRGAKAQANAGAGADAGAADADGADFGEGEDEELLSGDESLLSDDFEGFDDENDELLEDGADGVAEMNNLLATQQLLYGKNHAKYLGENGFWPLMPGASGHLAYLLGRAYSYGEFVSHNADMGYSSLLYSDLCGSYLGTATFSNLYHSLFDTYFTTGGETYVAYTVRAVIAYLYGLEEINCPEFKINLFAAPEIYDTDLDINTYYKALEAQGPRFKELLASNPAFNLDFDDESNKVIPISTSSTIMANAVIAVCDFLNDSPKDSARYATTLINLLECITNRMRKEYAPDCCLAYYRFVTSRISASLVNQDRRFSKFVGSSFKGELLYNQLFPNSKVIEAFNGIISNSVRSQDEGAMFLQLGMIPSRMRDQGYSLLDNNLSGLYGNFLPVALPYLDEFYRQSAALQNSNSLSYLTEVSRAVSDYDRSDLYSLAGGSLLSVKNYRRLVQYFIKNDMHEERLALSSKMVMLRQPYAYYDMYLCLKDNKERVKEAHSYLYFAARMNVSEAENDLEELCNKHRYQPLSFLVHYAYLDALAKSNIHALILMLVLSINGDLVPANFGDYIKLIERNHRFFANSHLKRIFLEYGLVNFNGYNTKLSAAAPNRWYHLFNDEGENLRQIDAVMDGNFAASHSLLELVDVLDAKYLSFKTMDPHVRDVIERIFDSLNDGKTDLERMVLFNWCRSSYFPDFLSSKSSEALGKLISLDDITDAAPIDFVGRAGCHTLDNLELNVYNNLALCHTKLGSHPIKDLPELDSTMEIILQHQLSPTTYNFMQCSALQAIHGYGRPHPNIFKEICRFMSNAGNTMATRFTHLNLNFLNLKPYGLRYLNQYLRPSRGEMLCNVEFFEKDESRSLVKEIFNNQRVSVTEAAVEGFSKDNSVLSLLKKESEQKSDDIVSHSLAPIFESEINPQAKGDSKANANNSQNNGNANGANGANSNNGYGHNNGSYNQGDGINYGISSHGLSGLNIDKVSLERSAVVSEVAIDDEAMEGSNYHKHHENNEPHLDEMKRDPKKEASLEGANDFDERDFVFEKDENAESYLVELGDMEATMAVFRRYGFIGRLRDEMHEDVAKVYAYKKEREEAYLELTTNRAKSLAVPAPFLLSDSERNEIFDSRWRSYDFDVLPRVESEQALFIYAKGLIDYHYFMLTNGHSLVQDVVYTRNLWQIGRKTGANSRSYASVLAKSVLRGDEGALNRYLYYINSHYFKYCINSSFFTVDESASIARKFVNEVLQLELDSAKFKEFAEAMALEGFEEFSALVYEQENGYVPGRYRFIGENSSVDYASGYAMPNSVMLYDSDGNPALTKEAHHVAWLQTALDNGVTAEAEKYVLENPDDFYAYADLYNLKGYDDHNKVFFICTEDAIAARDSLKNIRAQIDTISSAHTYFERSAYLNPLRIEEQSATLSKLLLPEEVVKTAKACDDKIKANNNGVNAAEVANILGEENLALLLDFYSPQSYVNYSFFNKEPLENLEIADKAYERATVSTLGAFGGLECEAEKKPVLNSTAHDMLRMLNYTCSILPKRLFKAVDQGSVDKLGALKLAGYDVLESSGLNLPAGLKKLSKDKAKLNRNHKAFGLGLGSTGASSGTTSGTNGTAGTSSVLGSAKAAANAAGASGAAQSGANGAQGAAGSAPALGADNVSANVAASAADSAQSNAQGNQGSSKKLGSQEGVPQDHDEDMIEALTVLNQDELDNAIYASGYGSKGVQYDVNGDVRDEDVLSSIHADGNASDAKRNLGDRSSADNSKNNTNHQINTDGTVDHALNIEANELEDSVGFAADAHTPRASSKLNGSRKSNSFNAGPRLPKDRSGFYNNPVKPLGFDARSVLVDEPFEFSDSGESVTREDIERINYKTKSLAFYAKTVNANSIKFVTLDERLSRWNVDREELLWSMDADYLRYSKEFSYMRSYESVYNTTGYALDTVRMRLSAVDVSGFNSKLDNVVDRLVAQDLAAEPNRASLDWKKQLRQKYLAALLLHLHKAMPSLFGEHGILNYDTLAAYIMKNGSRSDMRAISNHVAIIKKYQLNNSNELKKRFKEVVAPLIKAAIKNQTREMLPHKDVGKLDHNEVLDFIDRLGRRYADDDVAQELAKRLAAMQAIANKGDKPNVEREPRSQVSINLDEGSTEALPSEVVIDQQTLGVRNIMPRSVLDREISDLRRNNDEVTIMKSLLMGKMPPAVLYKPVDYTNYTLERAQFFKERQDKVAQENSDDPLKDLTDSIPGFSNVRAVAQMADAEMSGADINGSMADLNLMPDAIGAALNDAKLKQEKANKQAEASIVSIEESSPLTEESASVFIEEAPARDTKRPASAASSRSSGPAGSTASAANAASQAASADGSANATGSAATASEAGAAGSAVKAAKDAKSNAYVVLSAARGVDRNLHDTVVHDSSSDNGLFGRLTSFLYDKIGNGSGISNDNGEEELDNEPNPVAHAVGGGSHNIPTNNAEPNIMVDIKDGPKLDFEIRDELYAKDSFASFVLEDCWSFDKQKERQFLRPEMFYEDENPLHDLIYMFIGRLKDNSSYVDGLGIEDTFMNRLSCLGYYYGASDIIDSSFSHLIYEGYRRRFNRRSCEVEKRKEVNNTASNIYLNHISEADLDKLFMLSPNDRTAETIAVCEGLKLPNDLTFDELNKFVLAAADNATSFHNLYYRTLMFTTRRQAKHYALNLMDDSLVNMGLFDLYNDPALLLKAPTIQGLFVMKKVRENMLSNEEVDPKELALIDEFKSAQLAFMNLSLFDKFEESILRKKNILHKVSLDIDSLRKCKYPVIGANEDYFELAKLHEKREFLRETVLDREAYDFYAEPKNDSFPFNESDFDLMDQNITFDANDLNFDDEGIFDDFENNENQEIDPDLGADFDLDGSHKEADTVAAADAHAAKAPAAAAEAGAASSAGSADATGDDDGSAADALGDSAHVADAYVDNKDYSSNDLNGEDGNGQKSLNIKAAKSSNRDDDESDSLLKYRAMSIKFVKMRDYILNLGLNDVFYFPPFMAESIYIDNFNRADLDNKQLAFMQQGSLGLGENNGYSPVMPPDDVHEAIRCLLPTQCYEKVEQGLRELEAQKELDEQKASFEYDFTDEDIDSDELDDGSFNEIDKDSADYIYSSEYDAYDESLLEEFSKQAIAEEDAADAAKAAAAADAKAQASGPAASAANADARAAGDAELDDAAEALDKERVDGFASYDKTAQARLDDSHYDDDDYGYASYDQQDISATRKAATKATLDELSTMEVARFTPNENERAPREAFDRDFTAKSGTRSTAAYAFSGTSAFSGSDAKDAKDSTLDTNAMGAENAAQAASELISKHAEELNAKRSLDQANYQPSMDAMLYDEKNVDSVDGFNQKDNAQLRIVNKRTPDPHSIERVNTSNLEGVDAVSRGEVMDSGSPVYDPIDNLITLDKDDSEIFEYEDNAELEAQIAEATKQYHAEHEGELENGDTKTKKSYRGSNKAVKSKVKAKADDSSDDMAKKHKTKKKSYDESDDFDDADNDVYKHIMESNIEDEELLSADQMTKVQAYLSRRKLDVYDINGLATQFATEILDRAKQMGDEVSEDKVKRMSMSDVIDMLMGGNDDESKAPDKATKQGSKAASSLAASGTTGSTSSAASGTAVASDSASGDTASAATSASANADADSTNGADASALAKTSDDVKAQGLDKDDEDDEKAKPKKKSLFSRLKSKKK